jgi:hypothetical protein
VPEWVAIVGSRGIADAGRVEAVIRALPTDAVIVTGDAPRGVDPLVLRTANRLGREVYALKACWPALGKRAGPARNEAIARLCDRLVALWDGSSPGTRDAVARAERLGKPVEVLQA